MVYKYMTRGTCSRAITIELDGNIIKNVQFEGGCSGNTQGIAKIVKGMTADQVIERFKEIRCGFKGTSCPDQLAKALEKALEGE